MVTGRRSRRARSRVVGCGLLATALSVVGACGNKARRPTEAAPPPVSWHACDDPSLDTGECATVTVPVDHDDPTGATIDIAIFRLLHQANRVGVLFVNPGGPGASGIEYVRDRGRDGFPGGFDVIGFDPRGFGRSHAVECAPDPDADADEPTELIADDDRERQEWLDRAAAQSRRCADTDLGMHLGSTDVAADMDIIRAALGESRITYVGFSYGGLLGWTYASMFPTRVRAMVLDAAEDPGADERSRQAAQARTLAGLLDRFTTACAEHPDWGCPPDPGGAIAQVLAAAEVSPLPTGDAAVALSGDLALNAVLTAFYDSTTWPTLGRALATALAGDGAALAELSFFWRQRTGSDEYIDGSAAQEVTFCADHAERPSPDDAIAMTAEFGRVVPAVAGTLPGPVRRCWGYPEPTDPAPLPPRDATFPVVVVGATGDVATPYDGSVHLAEQLGDNARLVTRVGDGHTSYGLDRCVDLIVDRFLTSGDRPADDERCEPGDG